MGANETSGYIQLWLSTVYFAILYDPATFFAQNHLDKELDNTLIRNLIYYCYYTTYYQLSGESSDEVQPGGRC
jgi:hypothetical protein